MQRHPELVHSATVEDASLPLHLAAERGHSEVVQTLLTYPYPEECVQIFREVTGAVTGGEERIYRLGLSVNAKDARGQTALHAACLANNAELVKLLLSFQVKATKMSQSPSPDGGSGINGGNSDDAKAATANQNIGLNIRMRELDSPDAVEATEEKLTARFISAHEDLGEEFNPLDIDSLDLDGNTPLHLAVKGSDGARGFYKVAEVLLHHGANPNKPLISPSRNSSALLEACMKADVHMMDLLLRHKAQDTELKALQAAILSRHDGMIGSILKHKAHANLDSKINKAHLLSCYFGEGSAECTSCMHESYDSSNAMFPSHPVVIDWYGLTLNCIAKSWLLEACCLHNTNLPPSQKTWALYAITRLDVSKNNLLTLPHEVFQLPSLKQLNASHNCITQLPSEGVSSSGNGNQGDENRWLSPWLEDVQLQKNKLKTVPGALFRLPALQKLNLSFNEIDKLPYDMWSCVSLHDLNLTENRLRDLPSFSEGEGEVDLLSAPEGSSAPLSIPSRNSVASLSNTSEPRTPVMETPASPSHSVPSAGSDVITSHYATYRVDEVRHHAHWRGRLDVRMSFFENEDGPVRDQYSRITELNLSRNQFEAAPACLACLCPKLSKLDLSHNQLTQIGHLSCFPSGLQTLDLSHNNIQGHILFDSSTEEGGESRSGSRICFKPSGRQRR